MIYDPRLLTEELVISGRRLHFIGIGGVSMSSIAVMAREEGAEVDGCDLCENEGTAACREKGIPVLIGHDPSHVRGCDMVVFSSAVPPHNLELTAARENGVLIVPRAVMLSRLLRDRESIGIAGSHGKTTTTYIVSELFRDQGLDPSVMLGGRVAEWRSSFHLGRGRHFISEVDESDGSLLCLRQKHSLITNIDFDHVDYYRDIEHLKSVFRRYAENTDGGVVVACGDDRGLRDALNDLDGRVAWYGLGEDNEFRAEEVRREGLARRFVLARKGEPLGEFACPLLGDHNLSNAVGALALGVLLGLDAGRMAATLARLKGVVRRQDTLGERGGVTVLDDYAHHPTEIRATISALRHLRHNRLVVVFQPHRYTRTAALYRELASALTGADYVVLTDVYPANEQPITGVSSALIAAEFNRLGFGSYQYIPRMELILRHLATACRPGDLLVTMGAGDIRKLGERYVDGD